MPSSTRFGSRPEGREDPVVLLAGQLVLGEEAGGDRRGDGSHGARVYPRPPGRPARVTSAGCSRREPPRPAPENRLTRALGAHPRPVLDLTATNPTTAGLPVDSSPALALLADEQGRRSTPPTRAASSPRGRRSRRTTRTRGVGADPERDSSSRPPRARPTAGSSSSSPRRGTPSSCRLRATRSSTPWRRSRGSSSSATAFPRRIAGPSTRASSRMRPTGSPRPGGASPPWSS